MGLPLGVVVTYRTSGPSRRSLYSACSGGFAGMPCEYASKSAAPPPPFFCFWPTPKNKGQKGHLKRLVSKG